MLVDDLFELARIDAGALTLELREADAAAARRVVRPRPQAEAAPAASPPRRRDEGARARCAPAKVERVLYNLAHERAPAYAGGRLGRRSRRDATRRGERDASRTPARASTRDRAAHVRALLARRPGALGPRRGARARDRARHRRGARRPDLGGDRPGGGARVSFTLPAASA